MPSSSDIRIQKYIERSFASSPELAKVVRSAIERYPETGHVFREVIEYLTESQDDQRHSKRVKLEHSDDEIVSPSEWSDKSRGKIGIQSSKKLSTLSEAMLTVSDLSFVTPVRKKLCLEITSTSIRATQSGDNAKLEIDIPYHDISLIALLPVPEKAAKLYNFCVFHKSLTNETVVFTVPDAAPKTAMGPAMKDTDASTYGSLLTAVLNKAISPLRITEPDTSDFTSAVLQPHRKHERAVHITAHRGSKEGFLFFLSAGLVYGFKRPLLFIPLNDISSITYNDILQRTFNLTVSSCESRRTKEEQGKATDGAGDEQVEFSMIDISEYDRVDRYVKKYGLNDASLSESRRAKVSKSAVLSTAMDDTFSEEQDDDEIGRAANNIAGSVTGIGSGKANDDEEEDEDEDEDFDDDASHGGSTLGTDESGSDDYRSEEVGEDDGEEVDKV